MASETRFAYHKLFVPGAVMLALLSLVLGLWQSWGETLVWARSRSWS